jgi:integrase
MLWVTGPTSRSWVLRVVAGARRRDIGLGSYPDVTLESARTRARQVADQVFVGLDPVAERRRQQRALAVVPAVLTFEQAARQCHASKSAEFRSTKHRDDWLSSLERYAFPLIGKDPVAEVAEPHILKVLTPIWTSKTETASRVRGRMEVVLSWAKVQKLRTGDNPARWADNLKHALPMPSKLKRVKHRRALHWQDVPEFMAALTAREGNGSRCLEFAVLTLARSREVRIATVAEIDKDAALWTVPAEHMKAGLLHHVPLAPKALSVLKRVEANPDSPYVFPALRGGALSDMALIKACRDLGVDATPHGFRSSFKDWARTQSTYLDEVSELCLAHVNDDATRAAYARDGLLDQRRKLLAKWAAHCYSQGVSGA